VAALKVQLVFRLNVLFYFLLYFILVCLVFPVCVISYVLFSSCSNILSGVRAHTVRLRAHLMHASISPTPTQKGRLAPGDILHIYEVSIRRSYCRLIARF
jgi:hypothetical protein